MRGELVGRREGWRGGGGGEGGRGEECVMRPHLCERCIPDVRGGCGVTIDNHQLAVSNGESS